MAYTIKTGETESWGAQGTYFYGSLRVHYEVVYYPESNQSYVIMTPQFWTNANIGNDNRFFNASGSSYAGIYGNGNKLYEFSTNYGSGNYMACGNAQNTWTSLSGSVGMVIQHDNSGNSSFTTAVYCSVIALGYQIPGGKFATLRDFGNTTSNSISVHANAPYTLTYNANGGSGGPANQGVYFGISYTIPNTAPTRTGYTFKGWAESDTATTAQYVAGNSITPNGNLALYAVWKKATYTVSYNANGGTGAPASQTKTYDVPLTLTTTKPSKATTTDTTYTVTYNYHNGSSNTTATAAKKTAYTFSKWNTKSDGTGTDYSSGGTYSANAAATLYARYTSSTSTAAVTLPTPTKTGYSLNGWYTAETGGTKIDNGGASYTPTGNITLHAQWKGLASTIATISSSVATQGNLALTVTRMSSAYYHKATFKIGSTTMATSSAFATSLSYTIPRSWFTNYPNDTSKTISVSVQTYTTSACTPGTEVGSPATTTFTMTADSGMKPSVSSGWAAFAYYNTGTAASGIAGYVKGYSKAKVTFDSTKISLTNSPGATIASYAVTCLGSTDSSSPYYTPTLTGTSVTATCKVTDSRGRYATQDFTISVMDYAKPSISGVAVFRCNAGGTADEDGTYISVKATRSFSSLNSLNSCTLKAQIAPSGGSYGAATTLTSGTASKLGGGALSADTSYTVKIVAQDSLSNSATYYYTVPTRKWAMKFRSTGNGVAFGKAAETDNVFEVTPDWTVKLGTPLPVTSGGTGADTAAGARTNLGAVSKTGDTMTGNLVMSSKNVYIKSSHITQGTTPASNQYGNAVALRDSADKDMGLVRAVSYTDSRQGITLLTQRPVNGTTVYNELALHVKSDGTKVVNVTDAAPWRTALNAVNKSGDTMSGALTVSSGNITASAGSVIAGTDGNTAAERQISCRSGAGTVYLYSQASATGSRGLYVPAHGTGAAKAVISIDTNNNCSFNGNAATATKATQDADGNDIRVKYFNVYNTNNVNKSSTMTLNDLAKQGWAGGMFNPATDNPRGAAGWTMAYTASWSKNQNTDWVWQIANQPRNGGFGTERMWYRSTQGGGITGQGWVTLQDSKLLWTNASPNADFAAQKVSLTLNGFDAVKIVFCPFGGSDAATGVVEIPVGRNGNLFYMYFNTSTTGSAIAFLNGTSRTCYVATDGVTFSAGQMVYNNGVYTNWNGRSVPWKIYGVHW